eukprot:12477665-Alexandrium_andersonii.AAC.1
MSGRGMENNVRGRPVAQGWEPVHQAGQKLPASHAAKVVLEQTLRRGLRDSVEQGGCATGLGLVGRAHGRGSTRVDISHAKE